MADPEELYFIQQVLVHAYAGKWVKCSPAEAASSLRQLLAQVSGSAGARRTMAGCAPTFHPLFQTHMTFPFCAG
jgi:hypothetical protein